MEASVWLAVAEALQQPHFLVQEYQRRLALASTPEGYEVERKQADVALRRVKAQEDRATNAYINEAMDLERYKAEMAKLAARRQELERRVQEIGRREHQALEGQKALEHLEKFCRQVAKGLDTMTFEERQQLLRLVVERIVVEDGQIRIETVIPTEDHEVQLRTRHPELVEGRERKRRPRFSLR